MMSTYDSTIFFNSDTATDNNQYLKNGCQEEDHYQQPLVHIFIKGNSEKRYGCAECVSQRSGDRTLSLVTVMNLTPEKKLKNFPELDQKTKKESEDYIEKSFNYKHNDEIENYLDELQSKLLNTVGEKQNQAREFIESIDKLGDEMKKIYKTHTDCSKLREALKESPENINSKLEEVIKQIYTNNPLAERQIQDATERYVQQLSLFQTKFPDQMKEKIIKSIDKIVFSKQQFVPEREQAKPELKKAEHGINNFTPYLRSGGQYSPVDLSFANLAAKSKRIANACKKIQIVKEDGMTTFSLNENPKDNILSQVNSTTHLDPNLTYKFLFELAQIESSTCTFLIGLLNFDEKDEVAYEKTPFQKLFNIKAYEKGLSHVQSGRNLALIEQDEHRRFVFKVCIAKNIFKFTDEQKHSINILKNFEKAKPNAKYGLCIMSQIPIITLRLVSVLAK